MRRFQLIDAFAALIGAKTGFALAAFLVFACGTIMAEPIPARLALDQYRKEIEPLLKEYCYDCHGDGMDKGKVALDKFGSDEALLGSHDLWLHALKNVRSGLMPPPKKPQPTPAEKLKLEAWIKAGVFHVDPKNPDPGKVTVRRLNRTEYRNTIRDLTGVEFDTAAEFPADDSGHGFDNIGDVLTLSPMLLEKYLAAARSIITRAIPVVPYVPAEQIVAGREFAREGLSANGNTLSLSYYETNSVTNMVKITKPGRYQLVLNLSANERFVDNQFDYNKARLGFRADGDALLDKEFTREGGRALRYEFDRTWKAGSHELSFSVEPLTPDQKRIRSLTFRIESVTVVGPLEKEHWVRPAGYAKFFPKDTPEAPAAKRQSARELLAPFATKAYRRPVDERTLDRLAALAEATYQQPGKTFEAGVGQAMVAVLASPRFLFREEAMEALPKDGTHPLVDEYALASRLSYFLWSTMPDAELFRLAGERKLRANLTAQVDRMMKDSRFDGLIKNFVGQWLQARDIEAVVIDSRQVLAREAKPDPEAEKRRARLFELRGKPEAELTADERKEMESLRSVFTRRFGQGQRAELTGDLRRAMRQETERTFAHVIRENRSLKELLDSDYTFLNERLAKHYGLTNLNVTGDEMRLVKLPADSARGGLLTQGTLLAVTSNPTRTSPVKRGLFILENLLGTPPPPAPPDIPPLEDAAKAIKGKKLSLRDTLALHREQPLCSSCHNRMDPLGLALENFNAMGMWRDEEQGIPIDATATLMSGEKFTQIGELKKILATAHAEDFYRTVTEKLLTYALGRGLEYHDVDTVDRIVARLVQADGRPADLFSSIIESAPFQKTRTGGTAKPSPANPAVKQRADARIKP